MKFDAYEYTGVILPGSVVVLTASLLFPEVKELMGKEGVSLGGLGVFVVASFVIGHVVQGLGNTIEWLGSGVYGPARSNLLLSPTQSLVADAQRSRLKEKLRVNASVELDDLNSSTWLSVRREMYADVKAAKATDRIDAFNRTYGLQRGLAAGLVVATIMTLGAAPHRWPVAAVLVVSAILALFRMRRFGEHYIRELVIEYLRAGTKAPDTPARAPMTRSPRAE